MSSHRNLKPSVWYSLKNRVGCGSSNSAMTPESEAGGQGKYGEHWSSGWGGSSILQEQTTSGEGTVGRLGSSPSTFCSFCGTKVLCHRVSWAVVMGKWVFLQHSGAWGFSPLPLHPAAWHSCQCRCWPSCGTTSALISVASGGVCCCVLFPTTSLGQRGCNCGQESLTSSHCCSKAIWQIQNKTQSTYDSHPNWFLHRVQRLPTLLAPETDHSCLSGPKPPLAPDVTQLAWQSNGAASPLHWEHAFLHSALHEFLGPGLGVEGSVSRAAAVPKLFSNELMAGSAPERGQTEREEVCTHMLALCNLHLVTGT